MAVGVFSRRKTKPVKSLPDISDLKGVLSLEEVAAQESAPQQGEVMPRHTPGGAVVNIPVGEIAVQTVLSDGTVVAARNDYAEEERVNLRASIKEHGVQVPLIVRPAGAYDSFQYVVVKGTRRFFEAQELGLETVPCIVRNITRARATLLSLILTTHNKSLGVHEKGRAIAQIKSDMQAALDKSLLESLPNVKDKPTARQLDTMIAEYSDPEVHPEAERWLLESLEHGRKMGRRPIVSWDQIAVRIGLTKRRIHQCLNAADLPPEVHAKIESGELNERQVRAIAAAPEEKQVTLARKVTRDGLSAAQAAELARQWSGNGSNGHAASSNGITTAHTVTPSERRDEAVNRLRTAAGLIHGAAEEFLKLRESDGEFAPLLRKEIADLLRSARADLKVLDEVI